MAADAGDRDWLRDIFARWQDISPSHAERRLSLEVPSESQLSLLEQILKVYRQNGVVDGQAPLPPPKHCVHGADCWLNCPGSDDQGAAPLPWIGSKYAPGGVAMVGINLNEAWGLLIEYEITEHTFRSLQAGRSGGSLRPSKFSRAGRSLAALVQAINGQPMTEMEPKALPDLLERTARLQLVKCSPWKRPRSYPNRAMLRNCPSAYLAEELEILAPATILGLGTKVRAELIRLGARLHNEGSGLWVGHLPSRSGEIAIYCTYHPAAYGDRWHACYDRLLEYLESHT
jgi:hypothetical protein